MLVSSQCYYWLKTKRSCMCNFYVHVDSYTLLTLYSLEDTVGIPRATKMKQKSFFMVMFTGLIAGSTYINKARRKNLYCLFMPCSRNQVKLHMLSFLVSFKWGFAKICRDIEITLLYQLYLILLALISALLVRKPTKMALSRTLDWQVIFHIHVICLNFFLHWDEIYASE